MSRRSVSDRCGKIYLTSAAAVPCILIRRKMAHHSSLKTFHTTVFLTPGIFPKKRAAKATRFGAREGTCRLLRLCLAF